MKEPKPKKEVLSETKKLTELQHTHFLVWVGKLREQKVRCDFVNSQTEVLKREQQINQLQLQLAYKKYQDILTETSNLDLEYNKFISELSKEVGAEIKDCIIHPVTYEIQKPNP